MAMHRVAPDIPLWVGSIYSLSAHISFEKYNINHIISMVRGELPGNQIQGYTHLHVEMDDDEEENIMQYFPETNKFIEDACGEWMTKVAESGKYKNYPENVESVHLEYPHNPDPPGVLVHCMAGISRSSTIVIAYLMKKLGLTAEQGLALVKKGRKIANPNPSFVEQLKIYEQCGYEIDDSKPLYRQWILKKDSEGIPNIGSTPKFKYRSETEGLTSRGQGFSADFRRQIRPKMNQSGAVEDATEATPEQTAPSMKTSLLRCRMCRL
ncbi:protein-tyrosine phosphatase-like protein [Yarrowia lipolytica]|uniref:protein-tyrosine-phosphatase n=1 Tax=Yarrowia lipolytica TaxID=4952 RepID=A0A371CEG1_YARLL|nr:protein-tyrosine phosphatase-like protein [Yarrowia lipolytica]KAE8169028.1 protein-tyrosine phosphatase-like protein [Yarrowia lipolytica]RDW28668.1 protein-tyrosine phosphatase-like protein [Yarrowia lipolytica]RDW35193.1 protein-tyrosine phosphatase-like protein [Yarrowia lipolytica]RDW41065.1 protein-tyrosine phosphatase-like protein [Yarrowia lipolytica]